MAAMLLMTMPWERASQREPLPLLPSLLENSRAIS